MLPDITLGEMLYRAPDNSNTRTTLDDIYYVHMIVPRNLVNVLDFSMTHNALHSLPSFTIVHNRMVVRVFQFSIIQYTTCPRLRETPDRRCYLRNLHFYHKRIIKLSLLFLTASSMINHQPWSTWNTGAVVNTVNRSDAFARRRALATNTRTSLYASVIRNCHRDARNKNPRGWNHQRTLSRYHHRSRFRVKSLFTTLYRSVFLDG